MQWLLFFASTVPVITSIHLFVIHVIFSSFLVVQQEHEEEEPPSNFDDLHCEIISAETRPEGHSHTVDQNQQLSCTFCRNMPCILQSQNLPSRLHAHGQPKLTNHSKWKGDYKSYYTILKRKGLWRDPVYLQRKEALGCYIEDVREVMPVCVVEDVRKRWPNPGGVPYCGHRRSWNENIVDTLFASNNINLFDGRRGERKTN